MSSVLLILLIFVLAVILVLIYIYGTKNKNQKLLDEMDKKQQDLLVLQLDVQDMMLVLQTYMEESKQDLQAEREKVEYLIHKFEQMAGENPFPEQKEKPAEKEAKPKRQPAKKAAPAKKEEPAQTKQYDKMKELLAQGKTVDEIAQELGLSKGEAKFAERIASQKN